MAADGHGSRSARGGAGDGGGGDGGGDGSGGSGGAPIDVEVVRTRAGEVALRLAGAFGGGPGNVDAWVVDWEPDGGALRPRWVGQRTRTHRTLATTTDARALKPTGTAHVHVRAFDAAGRAASLVLRVDGLGP